MDDVTAKDVHDFMEQAKACGLMGSGLGLYGVRVVEEKDLLPFPWRDPKTGEKKMCHCYRLSLPGEPMKIYVSSELMGQLKASFGDESSEDAPAGRAAASSDPSD